MTRRLVIWVLLAGLAAGPAAAVPAGRSVALIIDTSGSMDDNDRPRYTVQITQILGDLLADDDELTVIRMGGSGCDAGASSQLALRLDPRDRAGFKAQLDRLIVYETDTVFAAPIRTAIEVLGTDPARERMLLIVADSGGLGGCEDVLTRELVAFHQTGATIAAVNLGSTAGAFDGSPAFDLTTTALDAPALVEAVAAVYQRFLGAKKVQTGSVNGPVDVTIPPHVREAFWVVAADGLVPAIAEGPGNPRAAARDLDYRGGGQTRGRDKIRGYRIARLEAPEPGVWHFEVPGLRDPAGWLLVLDTAVALRLVSQPRLARGVETPIEVEVYDETTGRRIDDPSSIPGLELEIEIDGRKVRLRDDGAGGDRTAGDGVLTGTVTAERTGALELPVRLGSDLLERTTNFSFEVEEATWGLSVTTPQRAVVGEPLTLGLELRALGERGALTPPEQVAVLTGGPVIELRDDGRPPDAKAGDLHYTGSWAPPVVGAFQLDYVPRGGTPSPPVTATLEVVGELKLGPPNPLDLGRGGSGSTLTGRLELTGTEVKGSYEVALTSDFAAGRSHLEIDLGHGWEPLGERPLRLVLEAGGARSFAVRLRIEDCPEAVAAGRSFAVRLLAKNPDGEPLELALPLAVVVAADPWLVCWWWLVALLVGLLLLGVVIWGLVSPARFPPHLGVVISPEENLEEGFFHPIRPVRGSGSGFFRDARVYVAAYQLSGRSQGAVARLRAESGRVLIEPVAGASLWRRNLDDSWEPLSPEESPARLGSVYRNELANLFFALRSS